MKKGIVPVRHMQGLIERGNRAGVDCRAVLEGVGCRWKAASQCNLHLTSEIYAKVALRLMEIVEDEFILLGGMPRTRPGTFAMMTHSVIDSADLRKALLRCGQFYQLFTNDLHFGMTEYAGSVRYSVRFDNPSLDWDHTTTECVLVAFHRFCCWLIGQPILLDGVELTCAPPADQREYWHLFGCPIEFNAPTNNLVFPSRYLHYPIRQNPATLKHFLPNALPTLMAISVRNQGCAEQIGRMLRKQLPEPLPNLATIANVLHVTPQTLRRHLKKENTSYQHIKDRIRRDAAMSHLKLSPTSIDDIADLTGFSAPDAFHRAFKRWTGLTPGAYRQQRDK